jgi:hypothetical protein
MGGVLLVGAGVVAFARQSPPGSAAIATVTTSDRHPTVSLGYLPPRFRFDRQATGADGRITSFYVTQTKREWAAGDRYEPYPIITVTASSEPGLRAKLPGGSAVVLGGRTVQRSANSGFALLQWMDGSTLIGLTTRGVADVELARLVAGARVGA